MPIPNDYAERVYAGVLGKIIGVYLGRPFEGWAYEKIMAQLGEVNYYVHEKLNAPLVVTDDDISGTFTFLRALPDYENRRNLTAQQIGQTWLNYLIEKKTILWWGGMGLSTEHTAFLRLKHGMTAPDSGSIAANGQVVAEQIGAQIFIDGWGMVSPGDPEQAAHFARLAGSVSHDGEAIYGAQVVAAMEAQAFVESDINKLLDTAVGFIPQDSVIYRLIANIREWHAADPDDWRKTRGKIAGLYGYDKYGGNCHMVPNHALIIHAILHGNGDFQKSLMIVNTCGWDTDCNSGNVGCLLGIRGGLAAIDNGPDWRGPVADRLLLPTADGGRCISDAVRETYEIVNVGRALQGLEPERPKNGARFHFDLLGSVQGWKPEDSPETKGVCDVTNENEEFGDSALRIEFGQLAAGRAARVATPTFVTPEYAKMGGYGVIACPTLYPGQTVRTKLIADELNAQSLFIKFYVRHYNGKDEFIRVYGEELLLASGEEREVAWIVPETNGYPIAEVGVEITSDKPANGAVYLDYLTWDGTPDYSPTEAHEGKMARQAWVEGVSRVEHGNERYRVGQDEGTGLLIQGCREWTDYRFSATLTPHLVKTCGIAARVQGMKRYYALLLDRSGKARIVKALDGETVLAESDFAWQFGDTIDLWLQVEGNRIQGAVNGQILFDVRDDSEMPLMGGAIAIVCEEGRLAVRSSRISPIG